VFPSKTLIRSTEEAGTTSQSWSRYHQEHWTRRCSFFSPCNYCLYSCIICQTTIGTTSKGNKLVNQTCVFACLVTSVKCNYLILSTWTRDCTSSFLGQWFNKLHILVSCEFFLKKELSVVSCLSLLPGCLCLCVHSRFPPCLKAKAFLLHVSTFPIVTWMVITNLNFCIRKDDSD
jgi:hypothetical protein